MTKFFDKIQTNLSKLTFKSVSKITLLNAKFNKKFLKKGYSIQNIKGYRFKKTNVALIVSGGPSLRIVNHLKLIKKFEDKLIIICSDGSLFFF